MNLIEEFFKLNDNARITNGDKWMTYSNGNWVVWERKRYAKKTVRIENENLRDALNYLKDDDIIFL